MRLDDQISTLQERLQQLKLRQQRSDARKRALEQVRERKADTRRRFLIGGVIQAKLTDGTLERERLNTWLDESLTRAEDRALFGLPPLEQPLPREPPSPRE